MIIDQGDRILVAHRRLFAEDAERYFVGVVEAYDHGAIRASGRTWVRSRFGGAFIGKPDERTKIFSVQTGMLIVYRLPRGVDVRTLDLVVEGDRTWLKDGTRTLLDLTEAY